MYTSVKEIISQQINLDTLHVRNSRDKLQAMYWYIIDKLVEYDISINNLIRELHLSGKRYFGRILCFSRKVYRCANLRELSFRRGMQEEVKK